jgi:nicotinamide-nucleotide amidase
MRAASPVVWIVATGSEILQGHYSDLNGPWLSGRLLRVGLRSARHVVLSDDPDALREGLQDAARQADLVIVTGGLGPTEDDLTRQAIASAWGRDLIEDPEALRLLTERLRLRGIRLLPINRTQARIPAGARLIPNANGTAPGFFIAPEAGRAALLALPGPPRELQPMFDAGGLPLVLEAFDWRPAEQRILELRTAGLREAEVNQRLRDLFGRDPLVEVGLLFNLGGVDVRMTFKARDPEERERAASQWREEVQRRLGKENVYGENGRTPAEAAGALLVERCQTVALAESCTGGLMAATLIDPPGASAYFREGFVTYANEAKIARLGVEPVLIERHGAVSAPVAEAMADGARRAAATDWAVSVTGIAGPDGGSAEKPVGLAWFGLARPNGEVCSSRRQFWGTRDEIRQRAALAGLDLLRRGILGVPLAPKLPEENGSAPAA